MTFAKVDFSTIRKEPFGGKDLKKLKQEAEKSIPNFSQIENDVMTKKSKLFKYKTANHTFVYEIDGKPLLFQCNQYVLPNLILVLEYPDLLPCVYVDDGAVRALLRGADLMAPGIKECPKPFEKDEIIAIRLLGQEEAFAIGITTVSYEEMQKNPKNVAIEIKHILKDSLWNARDGI